MEGVRKQPSTSGTISMSGFKVQLFFRQPGASRKAETKPISINPCKQEHLAIHLPAGLDAGLNSEVSHTLSMTKWNCIRV